MSKKIKMEKKIKKESKYSVIGYDRLCTKKKIRFRTKKEAKDYMRKNMIYATLKLRSDNSVIETKVGVEEPYYICLTRSNYKIVFRTLQEALKEYYKTKKQHIFILQDGSETKITEAQMKRQGILTYWQNYEKESKRLEKIFLEKQRKIELQRQKQIQHELENPQIKEQKKKKKKKKFDPAIQVDYAEPINLNINNRRYTTRINQLKSSRHQFCGIGTRKVKLRLNKLMKENPLAAALRVALEAEDNSIKAKAAIRKYGRGHDFVDSIYKNKEEQINQLLEICEDNGFNYGVRSSGDSYPPYIVYVDLPNTQQISYHTDVDKQFRNRIYKGEWDGKQASTLPKIQKSILLNFPEIVKESDKKTKVQKIKKKKPQYNFPPIKHILLGEY